MGQKTKEDADEFFDNYLKGQIPEGEDEDEDDEDDDAFGEGEEEDGDEGEMPDEPEDESDGDGAFCEEEPEKKKAQSKRDKAKEMRKMHKGASMWLRCTYVRAGPFTNRVGFHGAQLLYMRNSTATIAGPFIYILHVQFFYPLCSRNSPSMRSVNACWNSARRKENQSGMISSEKTWEHFCH